MLRGLIFLFRTTMSRLKPAKRLECDDAGSTLHDFPEAPHPDMCCGQGCMNCVWIKYADDLSHYLGAHETRQGDEAAKWKEIETLLEHNVEDVNLRAYLGMEIKAKLGV